jgi:hypothetical protein
VLNETFMNDNKAIKAGIIVADTAMNVNQSIANNGGVPFGLPAGALAASIGLAQLAALKSSGKGGGSISGGAGGAPTTTTPEPVAPPSEIVSSAGDVSGANQNVIIRFDGDDSEMAQMLNRMMESARVSGDI